MTKRRTFFFGIWIVGLVAALLLDRPVATWVRDARPVDKRFHRTHLILETLKLPGYGPVTAGIAVALGAFHRRHWMAALALAASGLLVGLMYSVLKWIVGRHRPVIEIKPWRLHPFAGGLRGLFGEKGICFPSGHASLAFATAMCLAILLPRWRWSFFIVATVTGVERIVENAHYVSDVVAGAGMGLLIAHFITYATLRWDIFDVSIKSGRPAGLKK